MFRIDRRLLLHFDWVLVGLAALLVAAGLLTLGSLVPRLLMRQLAWLGIGAAAVLVVISIDYRILARWAYVAYIAGLGGLAAVLALGRSAQGARRWLSLGPFTVQPSELFKLVLIATVAAYLAAREEQRPGWDRVLVPLVLVAPAFALIVKQHDLGTALVLVPVVMALLYVGGARWQHLAILVGGGVAAAPAAWL